MLEVSRTSPEFNSLSLSQLYGLLLKKNYSSPGGQFFFVGLKLKVFFENWFSKWYTLWTDVDNRKIRKKDAIDNDPKSSSDVAIFSKTTKRSSPVRNLIARNYIASPVKTRKQEEFPAILPKTLLIWAQLCLQQRREGPGDECCVAIFDSVSTWRTCTMLIRCFSMHEFSWRKKRFYNMRLWLSPNIGFFSLLDCSNCHFVGVRGLMASMWPSWWPIKS